MLGPVCVGVFVNVYSLPDNGSSLKRLDSRLFISKTISDKMPKARICVTE